MLLGLLALAAARVAEPQREPEPRAAVRDEVWVAVERPGALERLHALASDLDDHRRAPDGRAIVYADDAEQARLARAGFALEVVQEDLASFYAQRAASELAALGPAAGSMGGFRTLAEIEGFLDALHAAHPSLVSTRFSLGDSLEGRPLWAVRLSDQPELDDPGEPLVVYDALHHAREAITAEALLRFAESLVGAYPGDAEARRVLHTRALVLVPCVNPDGYERNRQTNPGGGGLWRKNRRPNGDGTTGVDLNRNYAFEWGPQWPNSSSGSTSAEDYRGPAPFSEPETQRMRDAFLAHAPSVWISAHSAAGLWLIPYGYAHGALAPDHERLLAWATSFAAGTGYTPGPPWQVLYPANGTTVDWSYAQLGAFAFTPEIGSSQEGFWPPPARIPVLCELVRPAYLHAAEWAGAWVELAGYHAEEHAGDGDAWLEPGEEFELVLELENLGLAPALGRARLVGAAPAFELVVPDAPFALAATTVLPATLAPAHAGAHAHATAQALPLRVRVAEDAPEGPASLALELAWEGESDTLPLELFVGTRRRLVLDDCELALAGWSSSTTPANQSYAFERADPQQTQSGGQPLQPADDHTPAPGVRCWVTGAAAGLFPSQNEVRGTARLVSPRLDLAPFGHVELSFARWFADFAGPADDRLTLEASNDDGRSWVVLEQAAHEPSWSTRSFTLEQHLALSDAMRLRFNVADLGDDDLCEALVDDLELATRSGAPTLFAYGPAAAGQQPLVQLDGPAHVPFRLLAASALSSGTQVPGVAGLSWLAAPALELASGTTDAQGRARFQVSAPSERHLQALFDEGGPSASFSNPVTLR